MKENLYVHDDKNTDDISIHELKIIKNVLEIDGVDFQYEVKNGHLFTNFMKYWDEDSVLQMDCIIQKLPEEYQNIFKKAFGNDIFRIHAVANIVKDFHYLNKNTKKFKTSAVIHMGFRGDNIQPWFTPFDFPYFKLINQLNNKCKEIILKYYPSCIREIKEPSEKLLKIALLHCNKKDNEARVVFENIVLPEKLQKLGIENNIFVDMNDIKGITEEAKSFFIYMHPELVDTPNNPSVKDLNDIQQKIYNKRIEDYNIKLVRQDYKNIEKIPNPSDEVRKFAISEFRKKWGR